MILKREEEREKEKERNINVRETSVADVKFLNIKLYIFNKKDRKWGWLELEEVVCVRE